MKDKVSVVRELAKAVATQEVPGSLAERLARASVALMGARGASITLAYTHPHRETLASTDERAAQLEDLQNVLGQGPGPTAYRTGRQVRAAIGAPQPVDPRWELLDAEIRWAFPALWLVAIPIHPDHHVLGVLTFHQPADRPPQLETEIAQFLADAVGVALLQDPAQLATDLSGPWATQAQLHYATGMVVAQLGIGPDEALAVLRAHAFAESSPLTSVAAAIIAGYLDFAGPDLGPDVGPDPVGREDRGRATGTERTEGTEQL